MSAVYFHTENGKDAQLRGSERAYAGSMCSDLFVSALRVNNHLLAGEASRYLTLFPSDHYLQRMSPDWRHIETSLRVDDEFFTPALNTALVMGSDAVKLLARLHGQCEIHAYVEGKNRAWLAAIIERGRETGVLRAKMGWEDVVTLLRRNAQSPIVTSYSVCDGFPNPEVAEWKDDRDGDDFYRLTTAEQWKRGMAGLRGAGDLELKPDNWEAMYFGDGTNAFDLLARVSKSNLPPEVPQ